MQAAEYHSRVHTNPRWAANRRNEKARLKQIVASANQSKREALELAQTQRMNELKSTLNLKLRESERKLSLQASQAVKKREERRAAPLARLKSRVTRFDRVTPFQTAPRTKLTRLDTKPPAEFGFGNMRALKATKRGMRVTSPDGFEVHIKRKPKLGARRIA